MTHLQDSLWGPIDMTQWEKTPSISGRLATEEDVRSGRAVFYLVDDSTTPFSIALPACAIHRDVDTKEETPVILIQAEDTSRGPMVGYRFLLGGNGVCTLTELEILATPDERFQ